jgi:hypothetical protein
MSRGGKETRRKPHNKLSANFGIIAENCIFTMQDKKAVEE